MKLAHSPLALSLILSLSRAYLVSSRLHHANHTSSSSIYSIRAHDQDRSRSRGDFEFELTASTLRARELSARIHARSDQKTAQKVRCRIVVHGLKRMRKVQGGSGQMEGIRRDLRGMRDGSAESSRGAASLTRHHSRVSDLNCCPAGAFYPSLIAITGQCNSHSPLS